MIETIGEIIGWMGTGLVLFAYLKFNFKYWKIDRPIFQWFNLIGALALTFTAYAKQVWPAVALNLIWSLIALQSIRKRAPSGPRDHSL